MTPVTSPTLAAYGDKWRKNLKRKDVPETASHLRVVYIRECFSSISLSPEEREYHDSQDLDVSKDALNLRSISQASVSGALGPSFLPQLVTARATRCQEVSWHVHLILQQKIMLSRRLGAAQSIEQNTASVKKLLMVFVWFDKVQENSSEQAKIAQEPSFAWNLEATLYSNYLGGSGETARDREERYLAPDAVRRRAASLPAFRKLTISP
ncbi:hypothetical protein GGX14DRAFT_406495 [Mycena pura]|uniref:Uncharacterized protein n=1 Tax=Mycena pura TaxID=153505 RepID=A0AAD6UTX5_9AGAR|nr:hypothetical protein GGX14DRAFT_406495 [Mycena pura]